jgi:type II secretion system-associated lipoprotein
MDGKLKYLFKKRLKFISLIVIVFIWLSASCASFFKDDQLNALKKLEENVYVLKADAGEGSRLLRKGDRVKLFVATGKDFIKIYCYPADSDLLKAERTLIVYLFDEDFENKKIDVNRVHEELDKKAEKK